MPLDPQQQQAIAAHLQFLRDLGIHDFYARSTSGLVEVAADQPVPA